MLLLYSIDSQNFAKVDWTVLTQFTRRTASVALPFTKISFSNIFKLANYGIGRIVKKILNMANSKTQTKCPSS
jgi:hypothetical protein